GAGGQAQPEALEPAPQRPAGEVPVAIDQDVRPAAPGDEGLQPGKEQTAGAAHADNGLTVPAAQEQAQGSDAAGQVPGPRLRDETAQPGRRAHRADEGGVARPEAPGLALDVGNQEISGRHDKWPP